MVKVSHALNHSATEAVGYLYSTGVTCYISTFHHHYHNMNFHKSKWLSGTMIYSVVEKQFLFLYGSDNNYCQRALEYYVGRC